MREIMDTQKVVVKKNLRGKIQPVDSYDADIKAAKRRGYLKTCSCCGLLYLQAKGFSVLTRYFMDLRYLSYQDIDQCLNKKGDPALVLLEKGKAWWALKDKRIGQLRYRRSLKMRIMCLVYACLAESLQRPDFLK